MDARLLTKFLVALLLFALLGGGYYFFYRVSKEHRATEQKAAYEKALFQGIDYRAARDKNSIAAFEGALKNASTPAEAVRATLFLASELFAQGTDESRARSRELFLELIENPEISPRAKAQVIYQFLILFSDNNYASNEFMRRWIFREEPFVSVLRESNDDIRVALRKAYELAESHYPLSLAEFRIALLYAAEYGNGEEKSAEKRAELLSGLQEWTEKGEKNMAYSLAGYDNNLKAIAYRLNGIARYRMGKYIGDKGTSYAIAEEAFKNALSVIGDWTKSYYDFNETTIARYAYAVLLADQYGKKQLAEIEELLDPLLNPPAQFVDAPLRLNAVFRAEADERHRLHDHRKDIENLAKISPKFQAHLEKLGIEYK